MLQAEEFSRKRSAFLLGIRYFGSVTPAPQAPNPAPFLHLDGLYHHRTLRKPSREPKVPGLQQLLRFAIRSRPPRWRNLRLSSHFLRWKRPPAPPQRQHAGFALQLPHAIPANLWISEQSTLVIRLTAHHNSHGSRGEPTQRPRQHALGHMVL